MGFLDKTNAYNGFMQLLMKKTMTAHYMRIIVLIIYFAMCWVISDILCWIRQRSVPNILSAVNLITTLHSCNNSPHCGLL